MWNIYERKGKEKTIRKRKNLCLEKLWKEKAMYVGTEQKKVYEGIVIAKRVGYYMDGVVKELTERVDRSIR